MKAIHKLTSWIGAVAFATVITMAVPTQSQATWSGSWTSWSKNSTTACDTDKGSKGSSDKGSTCNTDKGSKGSKGSSDKGSTCNTDKGSKGSKGSSDKGSKGSKGSSDKGSKGSKDHKGSKGSCNCDGKITSLTLLNNGVSGQITVTEKKTDNVIFDAYVDSGSQFTFNGSDNKGTMGTEIYIAVDDVQNIAIHTSCSKPIGIGMDFGDFTVIDGYSRNGGQLCTGDSNVPTGKVCGTVFEDTNSNGVQDTGEPAYAGAKVDITDANGVTVTATTDADGKYCQEGVEEGTATIVVDPASLPAGATITTEDPTSITVVAGQANPAGADGYTLPTPVGNVCGTVYEDTNDNGMQDAGETGVADIKVSIMDANGETTTVMTDADGKYCASDIVEGSATITVDPTTLPANAQLTAGVNPNDITVVANENNPAGTDGYIVPVTTGTACGTILVDGAAYEGAIINIVDANNETRSVTTGVDGKYCVADLPLGNATFSVDIGSLPYGVEQVQGEDPTTIAIEANPDNDAGIDAYEILYGKTCGVVLLDTNENGLFNSDDTGIEGVTVEVTDAEGVVRVRQTDANGVWCVKALSGGEAIANIIEDTLPAGAVQVYGLDPNPIMITVGQYTAGQADGFIINTLTCPVGFEKLSMFVFTPGRTSSDNLQTVLPIDITGSSAITFVNVHTSNDSTINQPYEQFMIASVDDQGNLLANTGWTNDINNVTLEDEFTDLGTLSLGSNANELLLVHRADPVHGDINSEDGNSVSFKGLCYKLVSR